MQVTAGLTESTVTRPRMNPEAPRCNAGPATTTEKKMADYFEVIDVTVSGDGYQLVLNHNSIFPNQSFLSAEYYYI